MRLALIAVVFVFAVGSACGAPVAEILNRTTEQVTEFFTSGPKVGLDPDVGLYRYNAREKTWEHIATIHSSKTTGIRSTMGADLDYCEAVVAALKTQPSTSTPGYSCRVLNK